MKRFSNTNVKNAMSRTWNNVTMGARAYRNAVNAGFRGTTLPVKNNNTSMLGVITETGYMTGALAKGIKVSANSVWLKTRPVLKSIGNGLYTMGKYVVKVTQKVLNGIKGWLVKILGTVGKFTKNMISRTIQGVRGFGAAAKSKWRSFNTRTKDAVKTAGKHITNKTKKIVETVDGVYLKAADKITKPLKPRGAIESSKKFSYRQAKRDTVVRRRATAMETATAILAYEGIKKWDASNSKEDKE